MAESSTPPNSDTSSESFAGATTSKPAPIKHREFAGSFLGLLIFAGGVFLLGLTFKLAYDLFSRPPEKTLGLSTNKTLDLAVAGDSAASLILRIVLLLVMAGVGSMVANRGIALYCGARNLVK